MKIGIFLPNATFNLPGTVEVGGIETFAFTIGEELIRQGHDVILYGGKPKQGREHRATNITLKLYDYVETQSIPDIGTRFQRLVQRLHFGWVSRNDLLKDNFEIILIFKPFDWPIAWYWKKNQPNLKVIMSFQGEDFYPLDKLFYSAVNCSFSVSTHIADIALRRTGKISHVIPNPVDTNLYRPLPCNQQQTEEVFQIASAGRLVGWKGFVQLIQALKIIHHEGIVFRAVIAGDGPAKHEIEKMILSYGLSESVRLVGTVTSNQLVEIYRQSDVFIAPSIGFESFSIATLEAASCGLPLILSDQIGIREFIHKDDYSFYHSLEVEALAALLIERIKKHGKLGAEERNERHLKIRNSFSVELIAQSILNLASSCSL